MTSSLSRTRRQCRAGLGVFLLWVSVTTNALASIAATDSHATLSTDGKRLLVMIPPLGTKGKVHDPHPALIPPKPVPFTLPNGSTVILHEAFTRSGCYDASTLAPIWQADWYSLQRDLRCSSDFSDIARLNRLGLINRDGLRSDWALAFYHEGKLRCHYDYEQLLARPNHWLFFDFTSSDWHSVWYDTFEIRTNQLILSTARRRLTFGSYSLDLGFHETHTFDLSSGAVVSRVSAGVGRMRSYAAGRLLVLLLIPLGFYLRRRARREQAALAERET